ncbi:MAG: cell division protein FtsA [Patescibacteria group bacterium]|nr:cell division protein FtsA [Patescibacteria group bacterium]
MANFTKSRLISAIDLGSSKIVTVVAQITSDSLSGTESINIIGVHSAESKGVKKGHIVDIEEAVEAITSSVEAAERMAGYNIESAYVSLGGDHVSSQNSHGIVAVSDPRGEIGYEDVNRVVEGASAISLPSSREIIHVLPREYMVDGETGVHDPVGMSGVRLEVETHLVIASAAAIKNLKKAVNEVGIHVNGFVFTGLAASEAVLTKTDKELGCILIDIGGGTTSVAVFIEGSLCYSGVIPIGAKYVTNDLAIGLRVPLETAEKIKLSLSKLYSDSRPPFSKSKKDDEDKKSKKLDDEFDLADLGADEHKKMSRKTLVEGIIRPRLNEIFSMVRMQIEKEGLIGRTPAGVVLTGGGAETVGVVESAKKVLALPVRVGSPSGFGGLIDDILSPPYAVSLGLVLYAARQENDNYSNVPSSLVNSIKLPQFGIVNKIIQAVKNLLP